MKKIIIAIYVLSVLLLSGNAKAENILSNPGFEFGKTGWKNSGGFFGITAPSNVSTLFGKQSAQFSAVASGNYLESNAKPVPSGLKGKSCMASISYLGSDENYYLTVMDGTSTELINTESRVTLSAATKKITEAVYFTCPSSGSIKLRIQATSTGVVSYFDEMYLGEFKPIVGTVQTEWRDFGNVSAGTLIKATTTAPTFGTIETNKAQWRRVGSDIEIRWDFRQTSAGTAGSGTYLFDFSQLGIQIDTTKHKLNTSLTSILAPDADSVVGEFSYGHGSSSGKGAVIPYSATQLKVGLISIGTSSARSSWDSANTGHNSFTTPLWYSLIAKFTVQGWSATDAVITAPCNGDFQCVNEFSATILGTTITHSSPSGWISSVTKGGTGFFNLNLNTTLNLTEKLSCVPALVTVGLSNRIVSQDVTNSTTSVVKVITQSSAAAAYSDADFSIRCSRTNDDTRLKQIIRGSFYKPYASAWLSTSFSASPTVPINFDSIEFTSASGLITPSTTAWKFTAPESGVYQVNVQNDNAGASYVSSIFKNGNKYIAVTYDVSGNYGIGSVLIKLSQNDYIDVRPSVAVVLSGGALTDTMTKISIIKVAD